MRPPVGLHQRRRRVRGGRRRRLRGRAARRTAPSPRPACGCWTTTTLRHRLAAGRAAGCSERFTLAQSLDAYRDLYERLANPTLDAGAGLDDGDDASMPGTRVARPRAPGRAWPGQCPGVRPRPYERARTGVAGPLALDGRARRGHPVNPAEQPAQIRTAGGPIMAACPRAGHRRHLVIARDRPARTWRAGRGRPSAAVDPLDALVDPAGRAGGPPAVDALQVAALLEADGVTDRAARVEYGYADVFALADEVYRRLGRPCADCGRSTPATRPGSRAAAGDPARLPLPAAQRGCFHRCWPSSHPPADRRARPGRRPGLGLGRRRRAGWRTSCSAARRCGPRAGRWRGRRRRGRRRGGAGRGGGRRHRRRRRPDPARRGVMAYQMASTLLVFYRRELWLAGCDGAGARCPA